MKKITGPLDWPSAKDRILHLVKSLPEEDGVRQQIVEEMNFLMRVAQAREFELQQLMQITSQAGAGLHLEEILEHVYSGFRELIPYDRIGLAILSLDQKTVTAKWAKAEYPNMEILAGYDAPLAGSSLSEVLWTRRPRIINDLVDYLTKKPDSDSTQKIVAEGIRSSLTCPLFAREIPFGFLFFSSREPNTYAAMHAGIFQRIAGQLSLILERGRLVTSLQERDQLLEEQNKELQRLSDLKNTFLGIAAHDLRGPIGNIQLAGMMLSDPSFPLGEAERTSMLQDILKQSKHMSGLLNDLLDITAIESGKLVLKPQPVDIRAFLNEAVDRNQHLAAAKQIRINLGACPNGNMHADPERLRQVLDNFLTNAVKYSPAGTAILVRAERTPNGLRCSVKDQGPGIQPADRAHLFQEFAKLSARPTGGEKSTGLGLAIARRIMQAHGGSIGVDSESGQGSEFWFLLPASIPVESAN